MVYKKAYAKINLCIDVIGKREDLMHEVDMILTPLALHDELWFEKITESDEIILVAPEFLGAIEDNLIYRAAKLVQTYFKVTLGAKIRLDKKIPMAAGLAGGSSDAAATLQGLVELWGIEATTNDLEKLAIQLGADVPYCLYHQTMRAQGIGEQLTLVPAMMSTKVVLFKVKYGISTKDAYANLQKYQAFTKNHVEPVISALQSEDYYQICDIIFNSFEISTFQQHLDLLKYKTEIKEIADTVLLSGSGPTLFAFAHTDMQVKQLVQYGEAQELLTITTQTI